MFAEPAQVEAVREAPGGEAAAGELTEAVRRVPMARRFHNDAVRAARALRRHRKVRWFRLAGHAPFPLAFEMTTSPRRPWRTARGLSRSAAGPDRRRDGENDPPAPHWPLLWTGPLAFRSVTAATLFHRVRSTRVQHALRHHQTPETGTARVKRGMAEMLKGGVIMDVVTAEQAKIAEDAGAVAVMALERVPGRHPRAGRRGPDERPRHDRGHHRAPSPSR